MNSKFFSRQNLQTRMEQLTKSHQFESIIKKITYNYMQNLKQNDQIYTRRINQLMTQKQIVNDEITILFHQQYVNYIFSISHINASISQMYTELQTHLIHSMILKIVPKQQQIQKHKQ